MLARFWADFLAAIEKQPGFYREPYFTHSPSTKRVVLVDRVRILEGLSMKRGVLVDRVGVLEGLSMKRGIFVDSVGVLEDLSMKRGVLVDRV